MNSILNTITVFVVNLKKDKEKKEHMLELCKKFSLNCHFIDAVYGKSLSEEEIRKHYAQEMAIKYTKRKMSRGEIGCLLSHKNIYQKMLDNDLTQALILEDDIEFDEDIIELFEYIKVFPNNWELILLGHHSRIGRYVNTKGSIWWKQILSKKYKLIRPSDVGRGTYGYLINKKGASKLLNTLDQYYKPIDHYTGHDKEINVYAISPAPIRIHTEMSDHHHSMYDRKKDLKRIVTENKSKKMHPKQLLRSLGLFHTLVSFRDYFKTFLPLKKYK